MWQEHRCYRVLLPVLLPSRNGHQRNGCGTGPSCGSRCGSGRAILFNHRHSKSSRPLNCQCTPAHAAPIVGPILHGVSPQPPTRNSLAQHARNAHQGPLLHMVIGDRPDEPPSSRAHQSTGFEGPIAVVDRSPFFHSAFLCR